MNSKDQIISSQHSAQRRVRANKNIQNEDRKLQNFSNRVSATPANSSYQISSKRYQNKKTELDEFFIQSKQ